MKCEFRTLSVQLAAYVGLGALRHDILGKLTHLGICSHRLSDDRGRHKRRGHCGGPADSGAGSGRARPGWYVWQAP